MALQAGCQIGPGPFGVRIPGIQVADGQQALGPEMIWLGLQCLGEVALGLAHVAAFVLLESGQEVVECTVRLDALGRRPFLIRPVGIAGPLEAVGLSQVIGMSRPAEQERRRGPGSGSPREPVQSQTRRAMAGRRPRPGPSASRNSRGSHSLAPVRSESQEAGARVHSVVPLAVRREQLQVPPRSTCGQRPRFRWVEARELRVLKQGVISPAEELAKTLADLRRGPVSRHTVRLRLLEHVRCARVHAGSPAGDPTRSWSPVETALRSGSVHRSARCADRSSWLHHGRARPRGQPRTAARRHTDNNDNHAGDGQQAGHGRPPPHPFQAPLQQRSPPRLDRPVRKIAIEVVRERQRAGISLVGLFRQTFQADRFQVARNLRDWR